MLLIQLWGTKIDVLFLSNLMLKKVDSLQIFCSLHNKFLFVYINISSFFLKVLVLIKVVPGKNDYFLHQKFKFLR